MINIDSNNVMKKILRQADESSKRNKGKTR